MAKSYQPDDLAQRTYYITIAGTAIFIIAVAIFIY